MLYNYSDTCQSDKPILWSLLCRGEGAGLGMCDLWHVLMSNPWGISIRWNWTWTFRNNKLREAERWCHWMRERQIDVFIEVQVNQPEFAILFADIQIEFMNNGSSTLRTFLWSKRLHFLTSWRACFRLSSDQSLFLIQEIRVLCLWIDLQL